MIEPKGGRFPSLMGRLVGASEGIWKAWRYRHVDGDLRGLQMGAEAAKSDDPVISIVIPTLNRGEHLLQTTRELLKINRTDFEVILVDQTRSHPPDIQAALDDMAHDPRLHLFHQEAPNASAARNFGALQARAPIVLFLDDDITPMNALLEAHLHCYTDGRVSAVGGRIAWSMEDLDRDVPARFSPHEAATHPELPVCYTTTPFRDAMHLITCNMSVRRDRFMEVGGFNERFRGYGEDLELVARLRSAGGRCAYEPQAVVIHHSAPTGGTREGAWGAFPLGYHRARDQNLSTLLAIGLVGWIGYTWRRQVTLTRRLVSLLKGRRHVEYYLPDDAKGPVQEILRSKKSPFHRIWRLLQYKIPHLVGAIAGTIVALFIWLYIPNEHGSLLEGNREMDP